MAQVKAAASGELANVQRTGSAFIFALITAYILCDVGNFLSAELASNKGTGEGYHKETVTICTSTISVVIGVVYCWCTTDRNNKSTTPWREVQKCFALKNVFNPWTAAPSLFFAISSISMLEAFDSLDAASIKLVGQVKLPLAALAARFILKKEYSRSQWFTMLMICCACACFTALTIGVGKVDGLLNVSTMVICNVFATLCAEKRFKESGLPFVVIMTNIRIGEIFFALTINCYQHGLSGGLMGFFSNWDISIIRVLVAHICDLWMTAFMVKKLSAVSKYVVKCVSMIVLFSIAVWRGTNGTRALPTLPQALVAVLIILFTLQFAKLQREKDESPQVAKQSA